MVAATLGTDRGVVHQRRLHPGTSRLRVLQGSTSGGVTSLVTDEALIDAVRQGQSAAASEIYDRLFAIVDRTLYRVMGQRDVDHDDLVQQAFEQIVQTLTRHAFARMCSLRTWASRIATNVALNALRSRRRERAVIDRVSIFDDDAMGSTGRHPQHVLESRAELARVRELLAEMKRDQTEILLLHDVMGHDLAEIATMFGISMSAAQSRLYRGRVELRQRLDAQRIPTDGGDS